VEAELGYDPLVDATDITVKNINGDVAVDGTGWDESRPRRNNAGL
jgi:DUF4097 and DUF4098 domain-containing protein YvlB